MTRWLPNPSMGSAGGINRPHYLVWAVLTLCVLQSLPVKTAKAEPKLEVNDQTDFLTYWTKNTDETCYLFDTENAMTQAVNLLFWDDQQRLLQGYTGDIQVWNLFSQADEKDPVLHEVQVDTQNQAPEKKKLSEVCVRGQHFIVDMDQKYHDVKFKVNGKSAALPFVTAVNYENVVVNMRSVTEDETTYVFGQIGTNNVTLYATYSPTTAASSCKFRRGVSMCGQCSQVTGFTRGHIRDKALGGFCRSVNCECETVSVNGDLRNEIMNKLKMAKAIRVVLRATDFREASCQGHTIVYPNKIAIIVRHKAMFDIAFLTQNPTEEVDGCKIGNLPGKVKYDSAADVKGVVTTIKKTLQSYVKDVVATVESYGRKIADWLRGNSFLKPVIDYVISAVTYYWTEFVHRLSSFAGYLGVYFEGGEPLARAIKALLQCKEKTAPNAELMTLMKTFASGRIPKVGRAFVLSADDELIDDLLAAFKSNFSQYYKQMDTVQGKEQTRGYVGALGVEGEEIFSMFDDAAASGVHLLLFTYTESIEMIENVIRRGASYVYYSCDPYTVVLQESLKTKYVVQKEQWDGLKLKYDYEPLGDKGIAISQQAVLKGIVSNKMRVDTEHAKTKYHGDKQEHKDEQKPATNGILSVQSTRLLQLVLLSLLLVKYPVLLPFAPLLLLPGVHAAEVANTSGILAQFVAHLKDAMDVGEFSGTKLPISTYQRALGPVVYATPTHLRDGIHVLEAVKGLHFFIRDQQGRSPCEAYTYDKNGAVDYTYHKTSLIDLWHASISMEQLNGLLERGVYARKLRTVFGVLHEYKLHEGFVTVTAYVWQMTTYQYRVVEERLKKNHYLYYLKVEAEIDYDKETQITYLRGMIFPPYYALNKVVDDHAITMLDCKSDDPTRDYSLYRRMMYARYAKFLSRKMVRDVMDEESLSYKAIKGFPDEMIMEVILRIAKYTISMAMFEGTGYAAPILAALVSSSLGTFSISVFSVRLSMTDGFIPEVYLMIAELLMFVFVVYCVRSRTDSECMRTFLYMLFAVFCDEAFLFWALYTQHINAGLHILMALIRKKWKARVRTTDAAGNDVPTVDSSLGGLRPADLEDVCDDHTVQMMECPNGLTCSFDGFDKKYYVTPDDVPSAGDHATIMTQHGNVHAELVARMRDFFCGARMTLAYFVDFGTYFNLIWASGSLVHVPYQAYGVVSEFFSQFGAAHFWLFVLGCCTLQFFYVPYLATNYLMSVMCIPGYVMFVAAHGCYVGTTVCSRVVHPIYPTETWYRSVGGSIALAGMGYAMVMHNMALYVLMAGVFAVQLFCLRQGREMILWIMMIAMTVLPIDTGAYFVVFLCGVLTWQYQMSFLVVMFSLFLSTTFPSLGLLFFGVYYLIHKGECDNCYIKAREKTRFCKCKPDAIQTDCIKCYGTGRMMARIKSGDSYFRNVAGRGYVPPVAFNVTERGLEAWVHDRTHRYSTLLRLWSVKRDWLCEIGMPDGTRLLENLGRLDMEYFGAQRPATDEERDEMLAHFKECKTWDTGVEVLHQYDNAYKWLYGASENPTAERRSDRDINIPLN